MSESQHELERAYGEDQREESRRRRTIAFLVTALVLMLLGICALGYFYLQVAGSDSEKYEPVDAGGYTLSVLKEYYGFGKGAGEQFNRPHDVNVTPVGELLIADTQNGRVVQMSRDGDLVAQVGAGQDWGPGLLDSPNGVAAGPDGRIYVADGGVHGPHGKLLIYSPEFSKIETEVVFPPANPPITPRVFGDELYVTSASGLRVYDLDGKLLRAYGGVVGKAEEEYAFPNGVVKRKDGTVVVAEAHNRRLKFLDVRGAIESVIGTPPTGIQDRGQSTFSLPMGLAEDEEGRLYLADAWAYNVRVLDDEGMELAALGDIGSEPGQFDAPAGLTYVGDREFLLADELNHRVLRIRITTPDDASKSSGGESPQTLAIKACTWTIPVLILVLIVVYVISRGRHRAADSSAS
ncbi:MAG: NHL repeat-containing protein [Coriobacteriia bacterium]